MKFKISYFSACFLITCLFTLNISAQEQLVHEKKIFCDSKGRLYVQKSLPIYFSLSTLPAENAESHFLKSIDFKNQLVPLYFKNEGLNIVHSPSAVDTITKQVIKPLQDVNFEVYADSKPPVSKINFTQAPSYTKNNTLFYGKNLLAAIEAKDEVSGVEKTYISIDKSPFNDLINQLNFSQQKTYFLQYYSVDNVGNAEKVKSSSFAMDITEPSSVFKFEGDIFDSVLSARSSIILSSTDEITGVRKINYQIDDAAINDYKKSIKMADLTEGEHVLSYFASDYVNNIEEQKTITFFVDKTPPLIIEELIGDTYLANGKEYSSGRTKLKLTAIDNRAGVKSIYYSINNEKYELYDKPFYLSNKKGTLSVKSYAIDQVNNKSTSGDENGTVNSQMYMSFVDLMGPDLSFEYQGPKYKFRDTMYISNTTKIVLKAKDTESGLNKITYSVDHSTDSSYNIPFSINGNGVHEVDFMGFDNVSNSNQMSIMVQVDESGPEINTQLSMRPIGNTTLNGNNVLIFPEQVYLFIAAFDNGVGVEKIYYTINNEPEKIYSGYLQNFKKNTSYHINIRSIDKLGNQSVKIQDFYIQ